MGRKGKRTSRDGNGGGRGKSRSDDGWAGRPSSVPRGSERLDFVEARVAVYITCSAQVRFPPFPPSTRQLEQVLIFLYAVRILPRRRPLDAAISPTLFARPAPAIPY